MNENINQIVTQNFEVNPRKSNSQKITALYCRVSTHDQHNGLESQIRTLKEFCEKNKTENFEIFTDEGISGAKNSRPSLDRMMSLVRSGNVESVVVYSISRFARSVTHLLNALEEFNKLGVSFVSYTEKMDTNSPMGKMVFVIISAVSALERDLIIERLKKRLFSFRVGYMSELLQQDYRNLLNSIFIGIGCR
jgi:DNA invertase Pin-like site-specific DNA recombinase